MNNYETSEVCNWLDEESEYVCEDEAITDVKVKTRQLTAVVPLCARHKAVHDEAGARLRTNKK